MKPADKSKKAVKKNQNWQRVAILCPHYQRDWIACRSISPMKLVWALLAAGDSSKALLGAQGGSTRTRVHTQPEPSGRAQLGGGRLQCPD